MTTAANYEPAREHLNDSHADTLLFLAQVLGDATDGTSAQLASIDANGLTFDVTGPSGTSTTRVDFDSPATDPRSVRPQFLDLVFIARVKAGGDDLTSIELEITRDAIKTFVGTVSRVEQISDRFRKVTIHSESLDGYRSAGPDSFVYVLVPPRGQSELSIDESFSWQEVQALPEEKQPGGAYYTVRSFSTETNELELWFVLHGDEGSGSAWATKAAVGDPVALWGPRTSLTQRPGTDHYLLVADETGVPALLNILEYLPADASIDALIEVSDAQECVSLQNLAGELAGRVTWLHRAGTETSNLLDAVKGLDQLSAATYTWGGAESRVMTAIRRHLRDDQGFEKEAVDLIAYWRRDS